MVAQLDMNYMQVARLRSGVRLLSYTAFEGRPATTRGRWINPLVLKHLRRAASRQGPCKPDRPIFLLGIGRSGTTLLGRVMSVHPDIGFLNEPKAMWNTIDPEEDLSGFYNRDGAAFAVRGAADVTEDMRLRASRLYGHYSRVTRSPRILDKYPELSYRKSYLRAIFPDCKLIAIVRRPEAVMQSIADWNAQNRVGKEDWWGVADRKWRVLCEEVFPQQEDSDVLQRIAATAETDSTRGLLEWIVGMRALLAPQDGVGLDLLIKYEDLLADSEAALAKLARVAELRPSDNVTRMARRILRPDRRTTASATHIPDDLRLSVDQVLRQLDYVP